MPTDDHLIYFGNSSGGIILLSGGEFPGVFGNIEQSLNNNILNYME
jgi:hypothetical protein